MGIRPIIRALLMALPVVAVGAIGLAGAQGGSARAEQMVLRLGDLPPIYAIGADSGCGTLNARPGTSSTLARFIGRQRPAACAFEYERLFRAPSLTAFDLDPPLVRSFAILTRSPAAAEVGFGLAPELAGLALGGPGLKPLIGPYRYTTPEYWPLLRKGVDESADSGARAVPAPPRSGVQAP